MTSSFKDDSYRRPNFAIDGALPQPQPKVPWWVNTRVPPTLPNPLPGSWVPQLPSPLQGPNLFPAPVPPPLQTPHDVDPPRYPNSLLTETLSGRAEGAPKMAPAERPGGLLGMLYEMMRQSEPNPDSGFDSNPRDASQQAPPERRLGRRTYRL